MLDLQTGQIVISKAGRDKGFAFVVVRAEGDWAFLADGRLRRLAKPKKKKRMHLQLTKITEEALKDRLLNGQPV